MDEVEYAEPPGGEREVTVAVNVSAVVYPDNLAALGVSRGLGIHGVPVSVLSSDPTGPGQYSRFAQRVSWRRPANGADLTRMLVDFAGGFREPPVLFLTDDTSLAALAPHRSALETRYRLTFPPNDTLRRLVLKDLLYRALEGVVPVPRTTVPDSEAELAACGDAIGYPAIVKPVLRCAWHADALTTPTFERLFGAKAIRVRSLDELVTAYRRGRAHGFAMLVQEEIAGPVSALHSVALYAQHGRVRAVFTSHKLGEAGEFGDGSIVQATRTPALLELAARAVGTLGHRGLADIEFKWDARDATFKLLDINPRPWLWINLPTVCGVNLPYAAYLDATGGDVSPAAFVQRDFETRWVSLRGVAAALVRALVRGDLRRLGLLLRQLHGRRVGPLFARNDLLFRMFLSPVFWWESFRQGVSDVRQLRVVYQGGAE